MTLFDEVKGQLDEATSQMPCFQEFLLRRGAMREGGVGHSTASDARRIFGARWISVQEASKYNCGFAESLQSLAQLRKDEPLELLHFDGPEMTITIFRQTSTGTLVGCICVGSARR